MDIKLTDIEANAVQHALKEYLKSLEKDEKTSGGDKKGIQFEEDAVRCVIQKIQSLSGASGA